MASLDFGERSDTFFQSVCLPFIKLSCVSGDMALLVLVALAFGVRQHTHGIHAFSFFFYTRMIDGGMFGGLAAGDDGFITSLLRAFCCRSPDLAV